MIQPSSSERKTNYSLPSHPAKPNRTPISNNSPDSKSSPQGFSKNVIPLDSTKNGASVNSKTDASDLVHVSKNGATSSNNGKTSVDSIDVKPDSNPIGFLPVLKNPNFLALWGGQVFCQLADKVYLVLMIAIIKTHFQTGEQTISGWVSAIMMAFTIPAVLFGSVAGVFVDRWSKKAVLVSTNILRGMFVFAIPILLWLTHDFQPVGALPVGFLIILAVTFLVSTLTQFFAPAEQAAIPLIIEENNLLSANSLYTTTMMASVIIGFAVGEPMLNFADRIWCQVGLFGSLGKEFVVGGSYVIAGVILLLIGTQEKPHPDTEAPHVLSDLRDGLRYLKGNHPLRSALVQLIVLFSVFAALTVLAVRLAEIIPNMKAEQFGFLLASGGVGIAIGAMLIGQFAARLQHSQMSLLGCIGMAASLIGLSIFTKQLYIVVALIMLLGVFGALIGIPMQTVLQTQTPPEMRGKVFGLQNNVINIALSLPLALAGVAETFFGLKTVFLGLAAIVILSCGLVLFKSEPTTK
ncbi:MFS transporter [Dulcicalothrix desertica]|nr:MFS transporter [Dulcicalothrix desertica]TWH40557.1 putative MFS family arabinose efflux permease [Dulcicalothrix desertica PCC 7102]